LALEAQVSASYAANSGDLSLVGDLAAAARACTSEPPSQHTYVLTPSTRLDAVPAMGAHAFELSDKAGWFGTTRLPLRAQSARDAEEWRVAFLQLIEQTAILQPQA
jgi:hypothetical protein